MSKRMKRAWHGNGFPVNHSQYRRLNRRALKQEQINIGDNNEHANYSQAQVLLSQVQTNKRDCQR